MLTGYAAGMRALPLLLVLPLGACGKVETLEFPSGLEPFDDALPACPADTSAEAIETMGVREDPYFIATGCGYVQSDYAAVVAAIQTPEVGIDRRAVNVDEVTITWDTQPELPVSYDVDTIVHDTVDVQYVLTWGHGEVGEGVHATRWQMTVTSPFISMIEGSVVATDLDGAVKVEMAEHIDAALDSEEEVIEPFLVDFHASIAAVAAGEALPVWE